MRRSVLRYLLVLGALLLPLGAGAVWSGARTRLGLRVLAALAAGAAVAGVRTLSPSAARE
ncbi:hypothetical protein SAMN05443639_107214 [Stigmatella erecta]|uniref:Uncharacterized protein n=1 Tax=Stigmatella erecta TaxID=83460 RepID=A0A1I0JF12_9BACT|nr:hypothetical protein SAMN05443639_107214 [Stigmatella erecta]